MNRATSGPRQLQNDIDADLYVKAFAYIAQRHEYREPIEKAGFGELIKQWRLVQVRLASFRRSTGRALEEIEPQLKTAYDDLRHRGLEQAFLRLYLLVRERSMIRADALVTQLEWSKWTPAENQRLTSLDSYTVKSDLGSGDVAILQRVLVPGLLNARRAVLLKPQIIVRREKGRHYGHVGGASRPAVTPTSSPAAVAAPLPPTPSCASLSPGAARMQDLLPLLKRSVDAMGPEQRAYYRDLFGVYLTAAEEAAPTSSALEHLAGIHNPCRFLSLIDAVSGPEELVQALGLERMPIPARVIRAAELGEYEVASATGAGVRFRITSEIEPGYREVASGQVVRRPKVEVQAE